MSVEDPAQRVPVASRGAVAAALRSSAGYSIDPAQDYLRAELFNRRTVEETKRFLEAVLSAALRHRMPLVLICVRNSAPIFTVERYGFSRYLDMAFESKYKIALVGDTLELRIAHQYIATMARMHGVKLRAFPEETAAIHWLREPEIQSR